MILILQSVIVLLIAAPALVRWLFRLPDVCASRLTRERGTPMSTSESGMVAQVEAKRSWKLPGIYAAACVLLVVFAAARAGT